MQKLASNNTMRLLGGLALFLLCTATVLAAPSQQAPGGNTAPPLNVSNITQIKTGSLGIGGSLSVSSAIQVGSTSAVCNNLTEGSVMYLNGVLQICSNTDAVTQGTSSEFWTGVGNDIYFNAGNAAIGFDTNLSNLRLRVNGRVGADAICDAQGNNCILQSDLDDSYWQEATGDLWYTLGNIGIGTQTPARPLSVHDNVAGDAFPLKLKNDNAGVNSTGIELFNAGQRSVIASERTATNAGTDLVLSVNNSSGVLTEGIRLTEAGRVGIGDATPNGLLRLDVAGKVGANEYCDSDGANCILAANLTDSLWSATGSDAYFLGGNIGIGVTNPQENLHTNLNMRTDGGRLYFDDDQHIYGGTDGELFFRSSLGYYGRLNISNVSNEFMGSLYAQSSTASGGQAVGLLDGDNNWVVKAATDKSVEWRVDDEVGLYLSNGSGSDPLAVGVGTSSTDTGLRLDVDGKVGATEYCDEAGANCQAAGSMGGDNLGNHTATTTLNMAGNNISNTGELQFNNGTNHSITSSASGLMFDGGDGTLDFLIYDEKVYTDSITLGYQGDAIITTYDSGEDLQISANAGIVDINDSADISGNLTLSGGRHLYFGSQDVYGDNSQAFYFDSNHTGISQLVLRDSGNTQLGSLYGSDDGTFGLIDADGQWAIQIDNNSDIDFRINNDEKMRITNAGNVGIGTTSPATKLNVAGKVGATEYCDANGANCVLAGDMGGGLWTENGSDIYYNSGNVGIGTTNPGATLDVDGDIRFGASGYQLYSSNSVSNGNAILHSQAGKGLELRASSATYNQVRLNEDGSINFSGTKSGTDVVIDTSGDMGIGDTTPSQKLEVGGNISMSSGRRLYFGSQELYGNNGKTLYFDSNDATRAELVFRDVDNTNIGVIYGTDGGLFGLLDADNNWAIQSDTDDNINFRVDNDEKMRITNAGNVGIGTTSPSTKLDVNGRASFSDGFVANSAYRYVGAFGSQNTYTNGYLLSTNIDYDGATQGGMHTIRVRGYSYGAKEVIDFAVSFYLYTGGISNSVVTNYGSYDPGTVYLGNDGNKVQLWWSNAQYYPQYHVFMEHHPNLGSGYISESEMDNWTLTDAVAPTNRVAPLVKGPKFQGETLVDGNIGATQYCDADGLNCQTAGNLGSLWTANGSDVYYNSGNVGIGMASPTTALDVNGDIRFGASGYRMYSGNSTGNGNALLYSENSAGLELRASSATYNQIRLNEDGSINFSGTKSGTDVVIDTSGDVGIGDSSPSQKLEVGGNISMSAGRRLYFGSQELYGDNGSYLYFDSNHSSFASFALRDAENDQYGALHGGQGDYFGLLDGDNQWALQIAKDDNINFRVDNDEKMRITSAGNVGIGTTNPSENLDVVGGLEVDSDVGKMVMGTVFNENANEYVRNAILMSRDGNLEWDSVNDEWVKPNTSSNDFAAILHRNDSLGFVKGGSDDLSAGMTNATFRNTYEHITILDNGQVGIGDISPNTGLQLDVAGKVGATEYCDQNGANCFDSSLVSSASSSGTLVGGSGTTNYVSKWNSAGELTDSVIYDNGSNVGIGDTSPSQKLEVGGNISMSAGRRLYFGSQELYGDNGSYLYFDSNHSSFASFALRDAENDQYGALHGGQGDYFGLLDGDNQWALQIAKDDNINFRVNNDEKVRITNAGNVGIGTTNPNQKLSISSGASDTEIARFSVSGGDGSTQGKAYLGLHHWSTGTNPSTRIGVEENGGGSYDASLVFQTRNGGADIAPSTRMTIRPDGNVGIATTTPSSELTVAGDIGAQRYCDADGLNCQVAGNLGSLWTQSGSDVYYNAGKVGIGISNPTTDLDVVGSAKISGVLRTGNWRHVLSQSFSGSTATNGYLLTTAIPYDASSIKGMHTIRVQGRNHGDSEEIDFSVHFYLYTGGFSGYAWTNHGSYDPGTVKLSYQGGVLKVWWSNTVYYPNFEILTSSHGGWGTTDTNFDNWTLTDAVSPSASVVTVPYSSAQPQGLDMGGNIALQDNWLSGDGSNEGLSIDNAGNVYMASQRHLYLGSQDLYGDNGSNLYFDSNDNNESRIILRDSGNTNLGSLYGTDSGTFGLLDGSSNWIIAGKGGNVGIGTTAPSGKLDVVGSLGNIYLSTAGNSINYTRNGANYIYAKEGGSSASLTLDSNILNFDIAGNRKMVIDNSGNVGIGTTAPESRLQIGDGTVSNKNKITLGKTESTAESFLPQIYSGNSYGTGNGSGNDIILQARSSSGGIAMVTDSFTQMYVTAGLGGSKGAVTIGTTSPSTGLSLDVEGKVGATEYCDEAGANCQTAGNLGSLWTANGSDVYYNSGNVGIGMASPTTALDVNGDIRFGASGYRMYSGSSGGNNNALLYSENSAGLELRASSATYNQIRLNEDGSINFSGTKSGTDVVIDTSGDMGIGDTTPSQKLEVGGNISMSSGRHLYLGGQDLYGDNSSALYFDANDSAQSRFVLRDAENDMYGSFYGEQGDYIGILDGDNNWALQINKDDNINFRVNNDEKMRITNNGKVGIGDTTPSYTLDITAPAGDIYATYVRQARQLALLGLENTSAASTNNELAFDFRLNTSAQSRTAGRISTSFTNTTDASRTSQIAFSTSDNGSFDENLVIKGGNVGIGTASPSYNLEIEDTSNAQLQIANTTDSNARLSLRNVGSVDFLLEQSGGETSFSHGSSERLRIDSDGNVGIGTNNPLAKLDVSGNMRLTDNTITDYGGLTTYENVAHYYNGGTNIGAIVVTIGNTPNMMIDAEITVQGYGEVKKFQVRGYTYPGSSNWHMPAASCVTSGTAGSCKVRFGKNSSGDRVIILGDTSTNWGNYTHASVTRVSRGHPGSGGIGNWSISMLTGLTGYTIGSTPNINEGFGAYNSRFTGNMGIDVASPSEKLDVNGRVKATGFVQSSDQSLKTNIATIGDADKLLDLRGVKFDWKADGRSDYGFIAQEVEALYPELVATDDQTGLKSVNYANMNALLLELVKTQQATIDEQEGRMDSLESRLEALEMAQ